MRINRYVASATLLSRRAADAAIQEGRVQVNGQTATLGTPVHTGDVVMVDGDEVSLPVAFTYVLMNKPVGYVVSRRSQGDAPTIYELLPPEFASLNPVGRLDKDSSGVLLLSDDGDFVHRAAHPSLAKEKRYEVTVDRVVTASELGSLSSGVQLDDGPSRPRLLEHDGKRLVLGLTEGRNRQIRRTLSALGLNVKRLHRRAFGRVTLTGLKPGEWRVLPEAPVL